MAMRPFFVRGSRQNVSKDVRNIHCAFLSFEEICPQWSLALQLGYTNNPDLDIQDGKKCIVGEAHGFRNRSLRCSKCWEYSQSFTFCTYGNKMHKYIITDNRRFEDLKFDFVSHFNEKHSLNRSLRLRIIDLLIRRVSSIPCNLKNLSLSFLPNQCDIKKSNTIINKSNCISNYSWLEPYFSLYTKLLRARRLFFFPVKALVG